MRIVTHRPAFLALFALTLGVLMYAVARHSRSSVTPFTTPAAHYESEYISPLATWPWPVAIQDTPHSGVTHWSKTSPDGTLLDLFDFDFNANPHLRLEIYDQDEDDATPFDNRAKYWSQGVGQVTRHLNASGKGKVVSAWNGLFFDFDHIGPDGIATHLTPVVLEGKVRYTGVGNHRWTFGVQYRDSRPEFKTYLLPVPERLEKDFDFAAGAAQCLIREGKPLLIQPFPQPGEMPRKRPIVTTEAEAGHIPDVDFIKTSRASLGWSRDNRHLYLLFVEGRTPEMVNALNLHHQKAMHGGWSVHELQQFWIAKKVWGAINSDGGDPAQMTYRRADGNYLLCPPHWSGVYERKVYTSEFLHAPGGGTLMYFVIRER